MPHYPQQNFNTMRQDTIRRSREMQRRAGMRQDKPETPKPATPKPETPPRIPEPPPSPAPAGIALPKELQGLFQGWDGERLALLALLYILYKDGADPKLLLAIAYILY